MKKAILFISLFMLGLSASGCSNNETAAKSLEQLYQEKGVPVITEIVKQNSFAVMHSYTAILTGIEESSANAMVSDKVDNIHVRVGEFVEKDDIIISFPSDNPTAKYYQAKVSFENAKSTYRRFSDLYDSGGISHQELDNVKTQYQVAEANWDAARQTIQVKAPISGYVTKINVRESDNVEPGDELFTISQTHKMKSKIWVPEKDINLFQRGAEAIAVWNDVEINGQVVQVDMSMNANNRAFGVVVEFNNPDKILKCGVTADVSVRTYSKREIITIERKNILKEEDRYYVFVVKEGQAEKRFIRLGKTSGMDVEILSGLQIGDELVTEGQLLLAPGKKINKINSTAME